MAMMIRPDPFDETPLDDDEAELAELIQSGALWGEASSEEERAQYRQEHTRRQRFAYWLEAVIGTKKSRELFYRAAREGIDPMELASQLLRDGLKQPA